MCVCALFLVCIAQRCRALSRAHDIYKQLHGQMRRAGLAVNSSTPDRNAVLKALLTGLFPHAAQRTLEGVLTRLGAQDPS